MSFVCERDFWSCGWWCIKVWQTDKVESKGLDKRNGEAMLSQFLSINRRFVSFFVVKPEKMASLNSSDWHNSVFYSRPTYIKRRCGIFTLNRCGSCNKPAPSSLAHPLLQLFTPPLLYITSPSTGNKMPELKVLRRLRLQLLPMGFYFGQSSSPIFQYSCWLSFFSLSEEQNWFGHRDKQHIKNNLVWFPVQCYVIQGSQGNSCNYVWTCTASLWLLKVLHVSIFLIVIFSEFMPLDVSI